MDLSECTLQPLSFGAVDADYSGSLDLIVAVGGSNVHVLDPATLAVTNVELPLEGSSISVGPDGLSAAVSHAGSISIVDLVANSVAKTISTSTTEAGDVVMANNGYAYLIPAYGDPVRVHSVELASGVDHSSGGGDVAAGSLAKLHPASGILYGVEHISTWNLLRWDLSDDVAAGPARPGDVPGAPDAPAGSLCGDLWLDTTGEQLVTGCGGVFRTAPGAPDDLTGIGVFEDIVPSDPVDVRYRSMAHVASKDRWYAIPGQQYLSPAGEEREVSIDVFDANSLTLQATLSLPCLASESNGLKARGSFVFASADGTSIYVLAEPLNQPLGLAVFEVE